MSKKLNINIQHKDRLFRLLFGDERYKANILSLYNALNGTDHKDVSELELYTIEDVIYIKMKNDVAIILDSYLSLWEQQSSCNPNMPLRGLMYFGKLYSKYVETKGLNIYGTKLQKIPTPKYIVFYNGTENVQPVLDLKLSDSFIVPDKSGDFEWTATMYNLNRGNNGNLLERCKPLKDYMTLIERIREGLELFHDVESAVDYAVSDCIKDGIMRDFLLAHRAEVLDMCITEFNEKTFVNGIKEEGLELGILKSIRKFLDNGGTEEMARKLLDATDEQLEMARKLKVSD